MLLPDKNSIRLRSCLVLFFAATQFINLAYSYQEIETKAGKVILDIDKQEALEKFGAPDSVSEDVWHYSSGGDFFVYFSKHLTVRLYPKERRSTVYVPVDFKVIATISDLYVKDVTKEARLLANEPDSFITGSPGMLMPTETGKYVILADYNGVLSNPCYLTVSEIKGGNEDAKEDEKLLYLDVLPYKPKVYLQTRFNPVALGTFINTLTDESFVRDITSKVDWFFGQNEDFTRTGQVIDFPRDGKFEVFCRYNNLESYKIECDVENLPFSVQRTLKHITLIPGFMLTFQKKIITLTAYGTFADNKVDEITDSVKWQIDNRKVLRWIETRNGFLADEVGIAEVTAELEGVKSLAAKITVAPAKEGEDSKKKNSQKNKAQAASKDKEDKKGEDEKKEKNKQPDKKGKSDTEKNSKNEKEDKFSNILDKKDRKLDAIKIIPDQIKIKLGEQGKASASGVFNDNTEEDFTLLGEWYSSDTNIAAVSKGKINPLSIGKCDIYLRFRGKTSLPAKVEVQPPELVSIIISPSKLKLSLNTKLSLKAEGYYKDSSRKDITASVDWKIDKHNIVSIDRGKIKPLGFGKTKVYAEYKGTRSLAADVSVVFTFALFLEILLKIIFCAVLGALLLLAFLFYLTTVKKNEIKEAFSKDKKRFIISLYENLNSLLAIFGLRNEERLPPLSFANFVENKYNLKTGVFVNLTSRYEEAKFSNHILQTKDALQAVNDYNDFLPAFLCRYNKFILFCKFCRALIRRVFLSTIKI